MGKYLKLAKWEFLASNLLAVGNVLCLSYYPWLLSFVIDHFEVLDGRKILLLVASFVLSVLGILTVSYGNKIAKAGYERKICSALRRDVFAGIANLEDSDFHSRKNEDYISFLMNDIDRLYALYFENGIYLVNSILMLAVYTLILARLSWQMCLVIMGSLVLIFVVPRLVGRRFHALNQALSASKADYLSRCGELLSAHDLMDHENRARLCGLHNVQLENMQERSYELTQYRSFVQVFSGSALYVQLLACFGAGLALANAGVISLGLFASSLLYVEYVAQYSSTIVDEFLEIRSAKTYWDRCLAFLSVPQQKEAREEAFESLTLHGVSYAAGEKQILQNVSKTFCRGRKYLITGPNGAGKSTLMKLLAGRCGPAEGEILFNGASGDFRSAVSYIPQRRYVFEGTLLDNLTLFAGSEADTKKLESLCRMVNLCYPLSHLIARNGENLSGGEIAKICLLRELYRNRDLLLIDEPMNDVDAQSARDILDFLLDLPQTVIMVAHGLTEQERFDEVLRVADGILK